MEHRLECDVAVVGAGSSGCVVAGRLAAESDTRVVLLEAGPDYGSRGDARWPADLLDGGALATSHGWGYTSGDLYPGRDLIEFQRARVIGGCSSHNGCIAAVGCSEDYDGWATLSGDDGWSPGAVRPLIQRALTRLRVRHYDGSELSPFHVACLDAAVAIGLPRVDDLEDLDGGVGFGSEPVNIDGGVRMNAAFAYLDPARERSNLRIVGDALCDRLVLGPTGSKSSGAETAGSCAYTPIASCWLEARMALPPCSYAQASGLPMSCLRSASSLFMRFRELVRTCMTTRSSSSISPARTGCARSLTRPPPRDSCPRSRHSASCARAARPAPTTSTSCRLRRMARVSLPAVS